MNEHSYIVSATPGKTRSWRLYLNNYLILTKPRVVLMVLVTTFTGFYLGNIESIDWYRLMNTLVGIALAAGGTMALNQYLERDLDSLMKRTQQRPLPTGKLNPNVALRFGMAIIIIGLLILLLMVNLLSSFLTAVIVVSYLLIYTPLKKRTPLSSILGGIPGHYPQWWDGWQLVRVFNY